MKGGWNDDYSAQWSFTTVNGLAIHKGGVILYNIAFGPLLIVNQDEGSGEFNHQEGVIGRLLHAPGSRIDPGRG